MGHVAVMGAGSWGSAFSMLCADAGEQVRLWARRPEVVQQINTVHRNADYLPDVDMPHAIRATSDAGEALGGAEIVVVAVPSHALRANLQDWGSRAPAEATFVSLIKGIETSSGQRASQIIRQVTGAPYSHVVVVSGPNLAVECAQRMPSGTVVAGPESAITTRVQAACHTPHFRVYTNPDVIGVELAGAAKNPIALAAGLADGMGFGDNSKAMLVTRGLAEITRLGVALGGNPLTFSGLAGIGDLVATCMSRHSRNHHVGAELGRGRTLEEITAEMRMVAEGMRSSAALSQIAERHGVDMPLTRGVAQVVHDGRSPREVMAELMGRERKSEFHGMPTEI